MNKLKLIRQIHLYFGVFIAPALIFFALTGAMQTFNLHETSQGSSYKPTTFLATMAQIHKKQTWMLAKPRPAGDAAKPDKASKPADAIKPVDPQPMTALPTAKWKQHLPLKLFFLLVSIGLFISTLTGITMAYKYNRSKLVVTSLLVAGTIIPLLLLPL
jgi:hypothetical protein